MAGPRRRPRFGVASPRSRIAVLAAAGLAACTAPPPERWHPANPADPDAIVCCEGAVTSWRALAGDELELRLRPDAAHVRCLGTGQTELPCRLTAGWRTTFGSLEDRLAVGARLRVCGYLVAADHAPTTHVLLPVTGVLPLR